MCEKNKKNESKKIKKKFEQYQDIALDIQNTLLELNLEQNEITFQLAKKITIDRQISGFYTIGNTIKEIIRILLSKYIPLIISFISGTLLTQIAFAPNEKYRILQIVLFLIIVGLGLDICVSGDESVKTYPLRIIKDMTYEEYTTLTKTSQNINCSSEKIDSTKY